MSKKEMSFRKIATYAIVIFVAAAFIFSSLIMGGGSMFNNQAILKINGETVSIDEFKWKYQSYKEYYQNNVVEGEEDKLFGVIKNQIINNLIFEKLLLQSAKKMGINLSDSRFFEYIASMKEFRTEQGYFDDRRYFEYTKYYNPKFESTKENEIIMSIFQSRFRDAAKITENEVRNYFEMTETKVKVAFIYPKFQKQTDSILSGITDSDHGKVSEKCDKFINQVTKTGNFFGSARNYGYKVFRTGDFGFGTKVLKAGYTNEYYQEIKNSFDFFTESFSLRPNQLSKKIEAQDGFIVLLVLSRKTPNMNDYQEKNESIRFSLLRQKQSKYVEQWYIDKRKKSKIYDYSDKFFKPEK